MKKMTHPSGDRMVSWEDDERFIQLLVALPGEAILGIDAGAGCVLTEADRALATEVVRRWNAFPALLAALKALEAEYPECGCVPDGPGLVGTTCGSCLARAALAAAKGEPR